MVIARLVVWTLFFGMLLGAVAVPAQDYPNKPIRIVTAAAGGGSDFTSRQIAQGISGPLGQPVVVENRGSGIILGEFLTKAPPDGYGLVVAGSSFWLGALLQKKPYDVARDFTPIMLTDRTVFVLAVHPSVPVKSVKELVAFAKARPGQLNYSSAISGSSSHLGMELFKSLAGVNFVWVPYKGDATANTALVSGEVQLAILDAGFLAPHVKSGRLRALAVSSAEPSALAPGLPTIAASGVPGYESVGVTSLFAPGKTPAAIVTRLNQEIVRYLNRADVKEKFLGIGSEVIASSPEQFAAMLKSDIARWEKVIKDAGIKVD